jgi:hypothetical protein
LLDDATASFIGDEGNVRIDHVIREVIDSGIFEMYRDDVTRDLGRRCIPAERGSIGYLASVADGTLRSALERSADYAIAFQDCDWDIARH